MLWQYTEEIVVLDHGFAGRVAHDSAAYHPNESFVKLQWIIEVLSMAGVGHECIADAICGAVDHAS